MPCTRNLDRSSKIKLKDLSSVGQEWLWSSVQTFRKLGVAILVKIDRGVVTFQSLTRRVLEQPLGVDDGPTQLGVDCERK
jgi:hypothetical protein